MNRTNQKYKIIIAADENFSFYQNARDAVIDALIPARKGIPTKLYRILEDGTEQLIYDSEKCAHMSIDRILEWAAKGGKR